MKFSGVPLGEACSIVLRGATEQIIGNVLMCRTELRISLLRRLREFKFKSQII